MLFILESLVVLILQRVGRANIRSVLRRIILADRCGSRDCGRFRFQCLMLGSFNDLQMCIMLLAHKMVLLLSFLH